MVALELKVPPLIQVIVLAILMFIFSGYLPALDVNFGTRIILSAIVFGIGAFFSLAGVLEFRKMKTTVDPRFPDKTSVLVDGGIYRISRNPMYVGFALFLTAMVVFYCSPVLMLGVIIFVLYMNRFQISPEEVYLASSFGTEYESYKQKVRRWL